MFDTECDFVITVIVFLFSQREVSLTMTMVKSNCCNIHITQVISQNLKFPRLWGIPSPSNASPTHVLTQSLLSSCLQEIHAFFLSSFPPSLLPSFTPFSDISYLQLLKIPSKFLLTHMDFSTSCGLLDAQVSLWVTCYNSASAFSGYCRSRFSLLFSK